MSAPPLLAIATAIAVLGPATTPGPNKYEKDVAFALKELKSRCGALLKSKKIDWRKVEREFKKAAKKVDTDQQHFDLMMRLVARLRDGHARVELKDAKDIEFPPEYRWPGPGLFLCVVDGKVFVKNAWSTGRGAGIEPGMEILEIDGTKAMKWLETRRDERREFMAMATDHHAMFQTCHRGLSDEPGTRRKFTVRAPGKRAKSKKTVTYGKASTVPNGPAFYPGKVDGQKDLFWTKTESGHGYVHFRRCPGNLPELVDQALAALGDVPGMILDFRGNSGGGFDHDAVLGRFVPKGEQLAFAKRIPSAGERPYGGPVVVIVDGTTFSAGETASGMFKYDGRAYMIGESPTAGASASKERIELPSGLFTLRVAVHSNKQRYNDGRGLEGIGAIPHEIVSFDPEDLAAERDTLIRRAEELLVDYPQKSVPYDPAKFGWQK